MDLYKKSDRKFRYEIEGLRAVAAFLVAVYHIWLGRVSGGVDVFFVVSGFLITTSLLNGYERNGKVDFFGFILRLSKRLFPAAFTVLFFGAVLSFIFLPQLQWVDTIKEIIASAMYIENWQLAFNSVDYLAQNNVASPFQHFWAMSTQGQFYIIWPALLLISILLAKYVFKKSVRFTFLIVLVIVFISSITYSIYLTEINQPWAYFDTFTRVWEFAIGGLVALLISNIVLKKGPSVIIGWLGLIGLISCGILLQVSTVFPGYAALWPTLSAVFILLAGNQGGKYGVHRLLSIKPLVKFGGISYGFYLWHWPLLVFYFNVTDNESASLMDGTFIIALSIVLAYLTTHFIEKPIRSKKTLTKVKTASISVAFVIPVIIFTGAWGLYIKDAQDSVVNGIDLSGDEDFPGALSLDIKTSDGTGNDNVEFLPKTIQVKRDLPNSYYDGCHQESNESEVIECEYGNTVNPDYTIALVGGSHSAHWLPAIEMIAKEENIKVLNYTKSACRFSTESNLHDNQISKETCDIWNETLMDILIDKKPDLVFTTANATEQEGIPKGYINKWEHLNEEGINVLAIRDNPRFSFDVPSCIEKHDENASECAVDRDSIIPDDLWDDSKVPSNVYYADLSDYFCESEVCKPVVGNILVYRDEHHITATYVKTLAPFLGEEINKAIDHFYN